MAAAPKLDQKGAEREVGRAFLGLLLVVGLGLATVAALVALFVLVRPLGAPIALALIALGSWGVAAATGFWRAALAAGLAGAVLLLLRLPLHYTVLRALRPDPLQWLGIECLLLGALYASLFAAAWVMAQRAAAPVDREAAEAKQASQTTGEAPAATAGAPHEVTDVEFVEK